MLLQLELKILPKKVEEKTLPTPEELAKIAEDEAISENWESYKSSCRIARDKKETMPNMKSFARAASDDERVSTSRCKLACCGTGLRHENQEPAIVAALLNACTSAQRFHRALRVKGCSLHPLQTTSPPRD